MLRLFTLFIVAIAFIYVTADLNTRSLGLDNLFKSCKPVDCTEKMKRCQYGLRKENGCEICKCHDPCNPPGETMPCGANQKCSVGKTRNGAFVARCSPLRPKRNDAICKQDKVVGKCRGALKRFYYNRSTNRCEQFIYSGCGGNRNNFETIRECRTTCSP